MMYEHYMICTSFQTKTYNGSKFVVALFNLSSQNAINVTTVYRSHSTKVKCFKKNLQQLINEAPEKCPIILGDFNGDFNVDISKDTTQQIELKEFLNYMARNYLHQK